MSICPLCKENYEGEGCTSWVDERDIICGTCRLSQFKIELAIAERVEQFRKDITAIYKSRIIIGDIIQKSIKDHTVGDFLAKQKKKNDQKIEKGDL